MCHGCFCLTANVIGSKMGVEQYSVSLFKNGYHWNTESLIHFKCEPGFLSLTSRPLTGLHTNSSGESYSVCGEWSFQYCTCIWANILFIYYCLFMIFIFGFEIQWNWHPLRGVSCVWLYHSASPPPAAPEAPPICLIELNCLLALCCFAIVFAKNNVLPTVKDKASVGHARTVEQSYGTHWISKHN